jgi:hypothetical protein
MKHLFPEKFEIKVTKNEDDVDINSINNHFNKLKLFNFSIEQDFKHEIDENEVEVKQNEDFSFDLNMVNDLLKQNSEFLKNISTNK